MHLISACQSSQTQLCAQTLARVVSVFVVEAADGGHVAVGAGREQRVTGSRQLETQHRHLGVNRLDYHDSSISHRGVGARANLPSDVNSLASRDSARATYAASYGVKLWRSSQIRRMSGRWGILISDRLARSSSPRRERSSLMRPIRSSRRQVLATSRSMISGAQTTSSTSSRERMRSPTSSSVISAEARNDASTTITANARRDLLAPVWLHGLATSCRHGAPPGRTVP